MALEVKVPDIGDFKDIPVIEILVQPGQTIGVDDPLITLESDKATMEVPAPVAGIVKDILVKLGDRVSEGVPVLLMEETSREQVQKDSVPEVVPTSGQAERPVVAPDAASAVPAPASPQPGPLVRPDSSRAGDDAAHQAFIKAHASPAVRQFARELGVDLSRVRGSGPKGRVLREDVQDYVKSALQAGGAGGAGVGLGLLPWPQVDFSRFGPIEVQPLSRIRKLSGANLHRNWVMIPHVTNTDEADITDLDAFRLQLNAENAASGIKVTLLAFLLKAVCSALRKFPEFNASLDGDSLVLKQYYHIGFAADTPHGLVVPVIRDADKKGVLQIAEEVVALAAKARQGKLGPAEMQGGTFSISSLGGIGGTYFTPIINAPEVAILGVCRATLRPIWKEGGFHPRLMLPLSLSYDHRVIDGATAARFNAHMSELLGDMRRATL